MQHFDEAISVVYGSVLCPQALRGRQLQPMIMRVNALLLSDFSTRRQQCLGGCPGICSITPLRLWGIMRLKPFAQ